MISVVIAVVVHIRSLNAQFFIEYTKRYADAISQYQGDLFNDDVTPEIQKAFEQYVNLLGAEFYLQKGKLISPKIWEPWCRDAIAKIGTRNFRELWPKICSRTQFADSFIAFVEEHIEHGQLTALG